MSEATLTSVRDNGAANAIVFVHGFGGDETETWGRFPEFLMKNTALNEFDVYSLGYLSKLSPDFRGVWSGNPSISTLSKYLYTQAYAGRLDQYKGLVFIAHSMGGLVVQRALLDRRDLLDRTSHLFLFGTPSAGLKKAGWAKWFKRQVEDMAADGTFVPKLRKDWEETWPDKPPPHFWTVAGDADEFVPASSSLSPFPEHQQFSVPGNHLEIVKPDSADSLSVQIVVKGIQGDAAPGGPWNAARVALQTLDFQRVVDTLEPHFDELDDAHLVSLALALEGLGKADKTLEVMEGAGKRGTDARGVLAGRLKRRWLAEGRAQDFDRALELYSSAFDESVARTNHEQAYYHGINVCFLHAAGDGDKTKVPEIARKVLAHCDQADQDFWCTGTRGEARLYLGDTAGALESYGAAVDMDPAPKPWMLKSMHSQASQLAAVLDQHKLLTRLDEIFRQRPAPA